MEYIFMQQAGEKLYNHPKYTVQVFWQYNALKTSTGKTLKNMAFGDSGSYKSLGIILNSNHMISKIHPYFYS